MDKARFIANEDADVVFKVDDDCFGAPKVWETLIKAARKTDDVCMAIVPCLSNGVPTYDFFATSFFTEEQRAEIEGILLESPVLQRWDIDYSSLAPAYQGKWDAKLYYGLLAKHGNDRLGVHPVRFSGLAQRRINEMILENWDHFMNPPCTTGAIVFPSAIPYYCNSFFAIDPTTYKRIIDDQSLVRDGFDEIPFNLFRRQRNLPLRFLTNAWMIHLMYRSVGNLREETSLGGEIRRRLGI
jgi:hypothetical protein